MSESSSEPIQSSKWPLNWEVKVKGGVGHCFKCGHDRTEDFSLFFNVAKNTFFCKNCPEIGGSVIDLVCQIKQWDREKAVDWLVHRQEFDQQTKDLFQFKGKKKFRQL